MKFHSPQCSTVFGSSGSTERIMALIPARGGSKGIPGKNAKLLAGKPLVAYAVEAARRAESVGRVVVSTDSSEIASISVRYDAEVIRRPDYISGDTATSESALLHALDFLRDSEAYVPDVLVFLQCTSPLTIAEDIDGTVKVLLAEEADCALAVTPFHYFLWTHDGRGHATGVNHDKSRRLLRQDRAPQYLETGAVYAMRTQGFLEAKHRFFGKSAFYIMPKERCLEIDDMGDFELADERIQRSFLKKTIDRLPDPVDALVLDFDGVFTDNRVIVFQTGMEAVMCNRSDGWGLARLRDLGFPILILSTEENPVVKARCDKLGLPCLHGVTDKRSAMLAWLSERNISAEATVFMGNDVNDIECFGAAGCGVAVNDAHPDAIAAANLVIEERGGQGAVRRLCELIEKRLRKVLPCEDR